MVLVSGWKLFTPSNVGAVGGFDADADGLIGTNAPTSDRGFTACCWYKPAGFSADQGVILGFDEGNGYNGTIKNIEITAASVLINRDNFGSQSTAFTLTTGTWYFLALVVTSAPDLIIYWKAEGGGSLSSNTKTGTNAGGVFTNLVIGSNDNFLTRVNGSICLVRAWDRILSSSELLSESSSATPVSSTSILGDYRLASNASKLTATVGSNLTSRGAGSWSDDTGPSF